MSKTIIVFAFLVASALGASAATPAPAKAVAGPTDSHKYWLSADLNRLVFWKAPETARTERPTH